MTQKNKGGVTRRGLLWAGGLAAVPLPPAAAFDLQDKGMPWEGGRATAVSASDMQKQRGKGDDGRETR